VVRQNRLRGSDIGILVHLRKFTEIILRGKHGFECVEYAVLGLLADFVAGVFGRGEEGLELFDHYKRGRLYVVRSMRKHTKQGHHCSLEVHIAFAATAASRTRAAR